MPRRRPRVHREALGPQHGFFFEIERTLYEGRTDFQEVQLVETKPFGKV